MSLVNLKTKLPLLFSMPVGMKVEPLNYYLKTAIICQHGRKPERKRRLKNQANPMIKMNGTTMKASMKVETSLEAPKAHHECVVAAEVGAMPEAAVVEASEARLEISREKMAIVSKSAKVAYPWEVVEELRDVVISLHDVEVAEAEPAEISPVVKISQVKLIVMTEATALGYPLVILGDFKAVLIPGTILGIPPRITVRRQQRVIEDIVDQETTEVVGLDVGEGAVVEAAALAKTPLTMLAIGEMISHKLMTGIMRSILDL
jgi:hypothetical protein